jgi:hypothetical protein
MRLVICAHQVSSFCCLYPKIVSQPGVINKPLLITDRAASGPWFQAIACVKALKEPGFGPVISPED